jgi:AcrR family transcriptional regulator
MIRGQATRQAIVGAARRPFSERGYFATKVDNIAALARVAPATVYNAVKKAQTSLLDRMVTGRLSSVDVENFPSHESRRVQVHYRVHDVRHFSHSAHRM